ncbi:hypothetical protein SO802_015093 [Lithocarpus litseifolius]|uniref:Secreted protein n=1 Tax=Lithocarpus litseifolius TaxID=425828 RepID=A0AAW2CSR2_9ROSI
MNVVLFILVCLAAWKERKLKRLIEALHHMHVLLLRFLEADENQFFSAINYTRFRDFVCVCVCVCCTCKKNVLFHFSFGYYATKWEWVVSSHLQFVLSMKLSVILMLVIFKMIAVLFVMGSIAF